MDEVKINRMKIVLVNYRYFFSGGPERYMFNIIELLEKEGHEVIPFSVKHNRNVKTPYEKYFLSPVGSGDEVYFGDLQKNKKKIRDQWTGLTRMIYSFEAKKYFKCLLKDVRPDLVYILYFQSKISCSIIDVAHKMGVPIIQRISDYSLLCPCNIFFRQSDCLICELCTQKTKWYSVKYKCVYHSALFSFVKSAAIVVQNFLGIRKKISRFIFPSTYTMDKFIKNGFDANKCVHIPTFFNDTALRTDLPIKYKPFALFIGRTDPDKGLLTLLNAFIGTDFNLKIIGFSSVAGYYEKLQKYVIDKKHNIEFLGKMEFSQIQEYLNQCLFTIVPSEWYDNLPNTILESYAMHKCVVATNVGSLSENVIDGKTGMLFNYKDAQDLRSKITYLFEHPEKAEEFGRNARKQINTKFNIKNHLSALQELFEVIIRENTR
jgi:glycosyltransferase involved in cell wall biosynthesis